MLTHLYGTQKESKELQVPNQMVSLEDWGIKRRNWKDGALTVIAPIEGTPAWIRAGMKAKDIF